MKHLRMFRLLPIVVISLFSFVVNPLKAQTHTAKYVSMIANSGGYYEYLPQGYSSSTQSYPLIIFIHGIGELGDGGSLKLPLILKNGIPRVINQGLFPTSFTVNGQTHRFIVLSPQFKAWPSAADINNIITYATQHYRVNQSRIYVSGLSMGGGATWDFAATYPSRVAAIVPVCGASGPNTTKASAIANGKVQVWATHNDYDPTVPSAYTKNWVSYITQAGGSAKKTIWALSSHDAWTKTYSPSFEENYLNVYEWMLQYQKGETSVNQAPVANAGKDQNIFLPDSVLLNGAAADPDGNIVSYTWAKISGPAQGTIDHPNQAQTPVKNLSKGSYVFRLTVTDDKGTTATDDITVTVSQTMVAAATANEFSSYVPYNGIYSYGMNPGSYGSKWSGKNIYTLSSGSASAGVKGVGAKSFRIPLYNEFLTTWGLTSLVSDLEYIKSLGAGEITAFVGRPHSTNVLDTVFAGASTKSKVFKGMYEPVWLDAAQTQVNPNNTYAQYLYEVVKTYGQYVKFWEIVNEPDFTYSSGGWKGDTNPPASGSWFDHDPTAEDLYNLKAPVQYYIRLLRISWEVIKKLQPDDYVCTGGIGYRSFLDAILRNTDNPLDGSVTAEYPLKGGAYFDVLSFHNYPMFALKEWSYATGSFTYFRHSDAALRAYLSTKFNMDSVLGLYGYNGTTYPKKQFICTETGVSRIMNGDKWGSNEGQRNYMIKAHIASQKNGIRQTYWFQLGDQADPNEQFSQMGLYYYFGDKTPYNATPSDQGIALKTTSDLLYGKTYDAQRTAALKLPATADGAAFRDSAGNYTYVLWAKTNTDLSETATTAYSFPQEINESGSVVRKEWNFSQTLRDTTLSGSALELNASPSFFSVTAAPPPNQPPVANAGTDKTITLPANTIQLSGSGTDADGTIVSYAWSKLSGPAGESFSNDSLPNPELTGLVQGVYTLRFTVTDNQGGKGYDDLTVTVNAAANEPPTANAGADQTITLPLNSAILNGTGSDADGIISSFAWSQLTGPSQALIDSPSRATTLVGNLNKGIYQFELKITDNGGATVKDTVSITVNEAPNQTPLVSAGADQTITLPVNGVTLTGIASDTDGSILTYQWTKLSGPATGTIASPSAASTPVTGLTEGVYTFKLTVTDNKGATAGDEVVVTVKAAPLPANMAPVANAGKDETITLPVNKIQLSGTGTDKDGTVVSYSWSKIAGPESYQITSPTLAKTTVTGLAEGTYQFKLTVRDNLGAYGSDTVTVIVKPSAKGKSSATVYPNPATSTINVRIDAVTSKDYSTLRIYNSTGNIVYAEEFTRTQHTQTKQIDISGFEKGVYFVNVNADINTNLTIKFIKAD
jgi:poly(3-hydroxybutyrate) depolymerase